MNVKKTTINAIITVLLISLPLTAGAATNKPTAGATGYSALMVSADYVVKLARRGQTLQLVDVRAAQEFEKVYIPGSINIPMAFIKTKAYLKSKAVILVNEGFARRELSDACRSLNKLGFNIHFVSGGLLAWHQAGGALTGDLTRLQAYTRITSAMLHLEMAGDNIIAVDVAGSAAPEAKILFKNVTHIPFGSSKPEKKAFEKSIRQKLDRESQDRVLVCSSAGEDYPEIGQLLTRVDLKRVFYLTGGLKAYQSYVENLALLYKPREERVESTSCNGCGPVRNNNPAAN